MNSLIELVFVTKRNICTSLQIFCSLNYDCHVTTVKQLKYYYYQTLHSHAVRSQIPPSGGAFENAKWGFPSNTSNYILIKPPHFLPLSHSNLCAYIKNYHPGRYSANKFQRCPPSLPPPTRKNAPPPDPTRSKSSKYTSMVKKKPVRTLSENLSNWSKPYIFLLFHPAPNPTERSARYSFVFVLGAVCFST